MTTNFDRNAHSKTPFSVPRQLSEASVATWLQSLPLASRNVSIRALLALSKELNRTELIADGERLAIQEQLLPVAEMLLQQFAESQLADEAFPLSQSARQASNYCLLLALEVGRGYHRIASGSAFTDDPIVDEQRRITAIFRSLQAYREASLSVAECYLPSPQGFWRGIYALYRLAEANDLLFQRFPGSDPKSASVLLRDKLLAILLFSLLRTNCHRPREIRQIGDLINRFAGHADIRKSAFLGNQPALFVVDLSGDQPPYRVSEQDIAGDDARRFLFTRDLIECADLYFSGLAARKELGAGRTWALMKTLTTSLGPPERRRSTRLPESGKRVVIVGLTQMIESLWRGRPLETTLPADAAAVQYKGVKWLSVPDLTIEKGLPGGRRNADRDDYSEIAMATLLAERKGFLSRDDIWGDGRIAGPGRSEAALFNTESINFSARGYCLLWTQMTEARLRVGELVGFPTDSGVLHVGVVRWMSQGIADDLMLGIELLAPRSRAVRLVVNGKRRAIQMALFVPPDKRLSQPAAIFVLPASCSVGQALTVDDSSGATRYRIEQLLNSSPSFQQFALVLESGAPAVCS